MVVEIFLQKWKKEALFHVILAKRALIAPNEILDCDNSCEQKEFKKKIKSTLHS